MNEPRIRPDDPKDYPTVGCSTPNWSPLHWARKPKTTSSTSPLNAKHHKKSSTPTRAKKNTVLPATGAISSSSSSLLFSGLVADRPTTAASLFSPVKAATTKPTSSNPYRQIRVQEMIKWSQQKNNRHLRKSDETPARSESHASASTIDGEACAEPKQWYTRVRIQHALDLYQPCAVKQQLISSPHHATPHRFLPNITLTLNNQTTSHPASHHARNHSIWIHSEAQFSMESQPGFEPSTRQETIHQPPNELLVSCWTCCCPFPILIGETRIQLDGHPVNGETTINGFFPLFRLERTGKNWTKYITGKIKLQISFSDSASVGWALSNRDQDVVDKSLVSPSVPTSTSTSSLAGIPQRQFALISYDNDAQAVGTHSIPGEKSMDQQERREFTPTDETQREKGQEEPPEEHNTELAHEEEPVETKVTGCAMSESISNDTQPAHDDDEMVFGLPQATGGVKATEENNDDDLAAPFATAAVPQFSSKPSDYAINKAQKTVFAINNHETHPDADAVDEDHLEGDTCLQRPTPLYQVPFSPIKFNLQEMQLKRQQLRPVESPQKEQDRQQQQQQQQQPGVECATARSPMAKSQLNEQEIRLSQELLEQLLQDTKAFVVPMDRVELRRVVGEGVFSCVREALLKEGDAGNCIVERGNDDMHPSSVVAIKQFRFQCANSNNGPSTELHFQTDDQLAKSVEQHDPLPSPTRQPIVPLKILQHFNREITFLQKVQRNPHFVHLIGVVLSPPMLGIVTDFFPQGSLFHCMKQPALWSQVTLECKLSLALQISAGIEWLHAQHIVHRDIKAHNILVEQLHEPSQQPVIKICDLGSAACFEDGELLDEEIGSRGYTAPEILLGTGYTSKVDAWSFGILLWELTRTASASAELVTNPFETMSNESFVQMIHQSPSDEINASSSLPVVTPLLNDQQTELLEPILHGCWQKDPAKRWDFSQIVGELEVLLYQVEHTQQQKSEEFEVKQPDQPTP